MKEQIRNRIEVAKVMTQTRLAGKDPEKKFTRKLGSRKLFYRSEKLTIQADGKRNPQAQFSRVDLGQGAFVWAPGNKAGEELLASFTPEERDSFLYHVMPTPTPLADKPESKRIAHGSAIKSLPNGHQERDYFPDDDTVLSRRAKPAKVKVVDSRPAVERSEEEVLAMREAISKGEF